MYITFSLIYLIFVIWFFCLFCFNRTNVVVLRNMSLSFSSIIFLICLIILFCFDRTTPVLQGYFFYSWNDFLNIVFSGGVDGISLLFIILTSLLIPLCILYSWNQFYYCFRELMLLILLIEFFLYNFFLCSDLIFFFIFFETVLFPMFILIGNFGSRQRRIHASFQFFLYTMIGSFFMLIAILLVYLHEGNTDFLIFYYSSFSYNIQLIIWFFFFFSLAVKVPLYPVHIWLPEAHVEAPTVGSVILAGVLLKMGTYGMVRFLIPNFTFANYFYNPLIFILTFFSIYYISLVTFCQLDLKKLIAYSSISHMGYVTMGLFTFNFQGLQGSLFLMISHGIVSSLLFFLVGMLYDRYKTRIIFLYKSLQSFMPIFVFCFFIATLANIGFPGTISFIGEFLLMYSFISSNKIVFFFNCFGFLFSILYAFWLYNRISFLQSYHVFIYSDLSKREFFVVFPLVFLSLFLGIFPSIVLKTLEISSIFLLHHETFFTMTFYLS